VELNILSVNSDKFTTDLFLTIFEFISISMFINSFMNFLFLNDFDVFDYFVKLIDQFDHLLIFFALCAYCLIIRMM